MTARPKLSVEGLKAALDYHPGTGEFRWKADRNTRIRAGDIAGTITSKGYRHINIDRTPHPAQRLAVLFMTGRWPDGVVDHRDGNRDRNAWANLRDCTIAQNNLNRKVRGCTRDFRRGRWIAQIVVGGKQRKLGGFKTEAEAAAAYRRACGRGSW